MRNKVRFVIIAVVTFLVAATALVTCAVVFEPSPVFGSVTIEVGSAQIPLEQFHEEGKEVTLVTDISGISLDQPGEHQLEFLYKRKICNSLLIVAFNTPKTHCEIKHRVFTMTFMNRLSE